jgi:carboxymethylenebutenolidase
MAQTLDNIVDPNDAALSSETVHFAGPAGNLNAYVSRPKDRKNLGTVVVIHENRGLVGHIKDVARRFAKDGFAAIAVDCMGRVGGSDQYNGSDAATEAIKKVTPAMVAEDLTAAVAYMKKQGYVNGKVGVVGYCSGGRQTFLVACSLDVDAAVDCYGGRVDIDLAPGLRCPLLGLFGAEDQNPSPDDVAAMAEALEAEGKTFDFHSYDDAGHAFFSVDRPAYRPEAAKDGWKRIWAFFGQHL